MTHKIHSTRLGIHIYIAIACFSGAMGTIPYCLAAAADGGTTIVVSDQEPEAAPSAAPPGRPTRLAPIIGAPVTPLAAPTAETAVHAQSAVAPTVARPAVAAQTAPTPAVASVNPASRAARVAGAAPAPPTLGGDDDLTNLRPRSINSASFKTIEPGKSTAADLAENLGKPKGETQRAGKRVLTFAVEPFSRVEVTLEKETVASVVLFFDEAVPVAGLAEKLKLADVEPVAITDEQGKMLGQAFPERGVMFSFAPGRSEVAQILLETIDPEAFLLRAESRARNSEGRALADLDAAIQLTPRLAQAHAQRANILLAAGRTSDALAAIDHALALEPGQADLRLINVQILIEWADHPAAVAQLRGLLNVKNLPTIPRAQAIGLMADEIALLDHDYKRSTEQRQVAIKLVEPLATAADPMTRHKAKIVLFEAHLKMAGDVAHSQWAGREQTATRWLKRATEIAEDAVHDGVDSDIRLSYYRHALEAAAATQGKIDPSELAKKLAITGRELIAASDDPMHRHRMQWETGSALVEAAQAYRLLGRGKEEVENIRLAVPLLEEGSKSREMTPGTACVLAKAYGEMGVASAVQGKDHPGAVGYFEMARPLLDALPPASGFDLDGQGQLLVSMGISYWEVGRRDEALAFTQQGAKLMSDAVDARLLARSSLAIPYGNLSNMQTALGHRQQAADAQRMAQQTQAPDGPKRR